MMKINDNRIRRIGRMLYLFIWAIVVPCSCIEEEEPAEEVVTVGQRLPDFEVVMSDSTTLTGAMLREDPSLVMFFHTACPDCQRTLPRVQRLYEEFGDRMRFALISREDSETSVAVYWKENALTLPYSAQDDRDIYELFAYRRVPRIYVSDSTGTIRHIFTDDPIPTEEILEEAIRNVSHEQ